MSKESPDINPLGLLEIDIDTSISDNKFLFSEGASETLEMTEHIEVIKEAFSNGFFSNFNSPENIGRYRSRLSDFLKLTKERGVSIDSFDIQEIRENNQLIDEKLIMDNLDFFAEAYIFFLNREFGREERKSRRKVFSIDDLKSLLLTGDGDDELYDVEKQSFIFLYFLLDAFKKTGGKGDFYQALDTMFTLNYMYSSEHSDDNYPYRKSHCHLVAFLTGFSNTLKFPTLPEDANRFEYRGIDPLELIKFFYESLAKGVDSEALIKDLFSHSHSINGVSLHAYAPIAEAMKFYPNIVRDLSKNAFRGNDHIPFNVRYKVDFMLELRDEGIELTSEAFMNLLNTTIELDSVTGFNNLKSFISSFGEGKGEIINIILSDVDIFKPLLFGFLGNSNFSCENPNSQVSEILFDVIKEKPIALCHYDFMLLFYMNNVNEFYLNMLKLFFSGDSSICIKFVKSFRELITQGSHLTAQDKERIIRIIIKKDSN